MDEYLVVQNFVPEESLLANRGLVREINEAVVADNVGMRISSGIEQSFVRLMLRDLKT